MAKLMTHRDRMKACLKEEELDQVPVALWRHFPVDDQSADRLAAAVAAFQHTYDFDLIKVTPSSSYCLHDWGVKDEWKGHYQFVIHQPKDWEKLRELNPSRGQLGMLIDCLNLLVKEFSADTPIIQTIFSPLAQAKNLVGRDDLIIHMRKYPESVHKALEIITQTTIKFIEAAARTGIDGVFYAVQHAQYGLLSEEEFQSFCKPYDLKILDTCKDFWLNVGHIHGENVMFEQMLDYPVQVLNWHDRETFPSLPEAQKLFKGTVCGGLRQEQTMIYGTPEIVTKEAHDAIQATGGKRLILGTGCVVPIIAPHGNISAAVQSVGA
jgi:uroporphyrinogen decarboxylase